MRTSPPIASVSGRIRSVIAAGVLAAAACSPARAAEPARSAPADAAPPLDRAFISFRIGVTQWMPESRYRELLAMFEKYKGVTDEITFFTSPTHPPIPLDEMQRRCDVLARRDKGEGVVIGEIDAARIAEVRASLPALSHRVL